MSPSQSPPQPYIIGAKRLQIKLYFAPYSLSRDFLQRLRRDVLQKCLLPAGRLRQIQQSRIDTRIKVGANIDQQFVADIVSSEVIAGVGLVMAEAQSMFSQVGDDLLFGDMIKGSYDSTPLDGCSYADVG